MQLVCSLHKVVCHILRAILACTSELKACVSVWVQNLTQTFVCRLSDGCWLICLPARSSCLHRLTWIWTCSSMMRSTWAQWWGLGCSTSNRWSSSPGIDLTKLGSRFRQWVERALQDMGAILWRIISILSYLWCCVLFRAMSILHSWQFFWEVSRVPAYGLLAVIAYSP